MPRPRRSDDNRAKLLDEGLNSFIRHGYNGTGLKEVLDAVQVPKGSFYNYFKSKEDFGAAVVRHYAGKFGERMKLLADPKGDALAALKEFFNREIALYEACPTGCLVGNLAAELGGSMELPRQAMAEAMHGTRDALAGRSGASSTAGENSHGSPCRGFSKLSLQCLGRLSVADENRGFSRTTAQMHLIRLGRVFSAVLRGDFLTKLKTTSRIGKKPQGEKS